jgi:hypothetical protein
LNCSLKLEHELIVHLLFKSCDGNAARFAAWLLSWLSRHQVEEDRTMFSKSLWIAAAATLLWAASAFAQRGVGDPAGVAQQAVKPATVELVGTLSAIEIGPCKHTTGRAMVGTHLIVKAPDQKELNVHLGPADATKSFVNKLEVGESMAVVAFRTEKMPAGHYVAKKVVAKDASLMLRDDTLRPAWAAGSGPRANAAGPYGHPCMRSGAYYHRNGYAYGRGRGGYGYRWRR